jgi:uncharacterized protein (TIGR00255 family)
MIRSMTGFARVERQNELGRFSWEVRSVNHRYLDVSLRLPEEFRATEPAARNILGQYLSRGKIDATLRFNPSAGTAASNLVLNEALNHKLLEIHESLQKHYGSTHPPDLTALMRWPGLIEEQAPDPGPRHEYALELLAEGAAELQQARLREGVHMENVIRERLEGIEHWVGQVREWLPEIRTELRSRILARVADLSQPLDPGRLEQEVAILAGKIDVDEELDRLDAHVAESRHVLEMNEPVGRRLDFLMQEFNRESNTLSSKSVDQRTTQASVELKVLIEQMREQVQNIE